jgi:hypothetical protein
MSEKARPDQGVEGPRSDTRRRARIGSRGSEPRDLGNRITSVPDRSSRRDTGTNRTRNDSRSPNSSGKSVRKTYEVVAVLDGRWWAIEVTGGLPKDRVVFTQARRINTIEAMARDAIAVLLQVEPNSFDVAIQYRLPSALQEHLDLYTRAEELDIAVRAESADARSRAAGGLVAAGLTLRETGNLLGVSFQRVKQLVDRAPDHLLVDPLALVNERLVARRAAQVN